MPRQSKLAPHHAEIVACATAGWSDVRIARELESRKKTVCDYRKAHGIAAASPGPATRRGKSTLDPFDALIRRRVAEGWGGARIAAEIGCKQGTVTYYLKMHGIKTAHRFGQGRPDLKGKWQLAPHDALIRKRVAEGRTDPEIAAEIGCLASLVSSYRKRIGLGAAFPTGSRGEKSPGWKGGRYWDKHVGWYVYRPDHPNAYGGRYVLEHRLVMEEHLGRLLTPDEIVIHRDRDKSNNAIANLELVKVPDDGSKRSKQGNGPRRLTDQQHRNLQAASSAAKRGVPLSPEHRAKVSASVRAAWQRKREQQAAA